MTHRRNQQSGDQLSSQPTPLARRLEAPPRATPRDLFDLALRWWMAGERFDIGRMAAELGVSRATAFRWVGSRELLYGEVISALFAEALAHARNKAHGHGAAYLTDVFRNLLHFLVRVKPPRQFVRKDPEYAVRVLMSNSSTVEARCTALLREALETEFRAGHLDPPMDLDSLAWVILRIGEAFLYRDAITGEPPDVDKAITAIGILLGAPPARST